MPVHFTCRSPAKIIKNRGLTKPSVADHASGSLWQHHPPLRLYGLFKAPETGMYAWNSGDYINYIRLVASLMTRALENMVFNCSTALEFPFMMWYCVLPHLPHAGSTGGWPPASAKIFQITSNENSELLAKKGNSKMPGMFGERSRIPIS